MARKRTRAGVPINIINTDIFGRDLLTSPVYDDKKQKKKGTLKFLRGISSK